MTNRNKRLRKGITSLEEQIALHEEKLARAEKEGNTGLARYYSKEILAKKKDKQAKERMLHKR
ncbi:MAG TPA: hypothetical protein VJC16_03295 [Candidatus Nanoarchaeia archaeon]|nr:hypothetical protein [Candidatus Nanoarchaeia archaeon]